MESAKQLEYDTLAAQVIEYVDDWHQRVRRAFAYAPSKLNYTDQTDEVAFIDRHAITINERYVVRAATESMELAEKYFIGEDAHEHGHLHHWGAPVDTRRAIDYLKIFMDVMDDKKLVAAPFLANVVYDVMTDTGNNDRLPNLVDVEVSPLVIYDFYRDYNPAEKSAVDQFLIAYKEAIKGVEFVDLDLREDVRKVTCKCVRICRDITKSMEEKMREIAVLVFQLFKDDAENPPPPPPPKSKQKQNGQGQDQSQKQQGDGQGESQDQQSDPGDDNDGSESGEGNGNGKGKGKEDESGSDDPKEEGSPNGDPDGTQADDNAGNGDEEDSNTDNGSDGQEEEGGKGGGAEQDTEEEKNDKEGDKKGDKKDGKKKQEKKGNKSHEEILQEIADAIKGAMIKAGKQLSAPVKEDLMANPLGAKIDVVDWDDPMEVFIIGQMLNLERKVLEFFQLQARARRKLKFHIKPATQAEEDTFLAGHIPWDPCMAVESLDMQASIIKYGSVIFGATTVMPFHVSGPGLPGEGTFPNLKLYIDFSGSMDVDETLLAGMTLAEAGRTHQVKVGATLFADRYYDVPMTTDYDKVQRLIYDNCDRVGGGNCVPGIRDTGELQPGDLAIYVTDFGLYPEHQSEALAAIDSLLARGVQVVWIVMFTTAYIEAAEVGKRSINYKFCENMEQLADLVLDTVDDQIPR